MIHHHQLILQASEEVLLNEWEATIKVITKLGIRLVIDLVTVFVLLRGIYQRNYGKTELFFTFFTFNLVIFLISFLLNKVDLGMGAAFGLFAVFSMLRYKTEEISIKDMSYLFLSISVGLISAVTKVKGAGDYYDYGFLLAINLGILGISFLIDYKRHTAIEHMQTILYDNIDLIKQNNLSLLKEDIQKRTGIQVSRLSLGKIDLTKNQVQIKVYYFENPFHP